jgi:hypothetical protein
MSDCLASLTRRVRLCGFALIALLLPTILCLSRAEETEPKLDSLMTAGAKFGVTFFAGLKNSLAAGDAERAYSAATGSGQLQSDLIALGNAYKTERDDARGTGNFVHSAGELAITATGFVAAATGVGSVPSALVTAGANYANDRLYDNLRATGDDRAMAFLNSAISKWNSTNGVTYESVKAKLEAGDSADAAKDFDQATGMLTQLRGQLAGDTAAADAAQDYILATMQATDKATIEQTAENTSAIQDVQSDFVNEVRFTRQLAKDTESALQVFGDKLDGVDTALGDATGKLQDLERGQTVTAMQVTTIEQVMYDQQSPATKIELLQGGYRPELTDDQRSELITYLKAEQSKQDLIDESATVVTSAREIETIMGNLGFHDPTISKAVAFGSAAQTALADVFTGNYLGALASITGVFGLGSDPDAARFALIEDQLKNIGKQLDQVIDLQIKTLQAIQALSQQVATMDQHLNQRLDAIDFEIKGVSKALSASMWNGYTPCNTAWEDHGGDEHQLAFDERTYLYKTFHDLEGFISYRGKDAAECADLLTHLFDSIKQQDVFTNLLSLSYASQQPDNLLPSEQGNTLDQSDLQRFLTQLYNPTLDLLQHEWKPSWGAQTTLLAMFSDPSLTTSQLWSRLKQLDDAIGSGKPFTACGAPSILSYRLKSLFCVDDRYAPTDMPQDAESAAARRTVDYMESPMVRDQLYVFARWTGLVARPYDLWTGDNSYQFYSRQDVLGGKGVPRGKDLIWAFLSVLDVGIAQQSMLHGDFTAKAIYDLAWDDANHVPVEKQSGQAALQTEAIELLQNGNNPWLAQNVLQIALEHALLITGDEADPGVPYEQAMSQFDAVGDTAHLTTDDNLKIAAGTLFLKGMFSLPDDVKFEVLDSTDDSGKKSRKVLFEHGSYKLPMPSVAQFSQHQLSYPPSVLSLIALREVYADRLVDYDLLGKIGDPAQRARMAAVLYSGLAQQCTDHEIVVPGAVRYADPSPNVTCGAN